MSYKRFFNVIYDDRGRRHWKASSDEKPPSPTPEKKSELPIDYSKALEARPDPPTASLKIGRVKIDKSKQDFDKSLGLVCKLCDFSAKDNHSWLDHLNSVEHNRKLGNHMKVEKITADVVEDHLKSLKLKKIKKPAPTLQEIMKRLEEGEPSKKIKVKEDEEED